MPSDRGRPEHQIAENTRQLDRVDGRFVTVSNDPSREERVDNLQARVSAAKTHWSVRERNLGGALIMGHSDAEHGVGRGSIGDRREAWTDVHGDASVSISAGAPRASAAALAGEAFLASIVTGTGSESPSRSDDALESHNEAFDPDVGADGATVLAAAYLAFDVDGPESVGEWGVESDASDLVARATGDSTTSLTAEETLLTVAIEFEGIAARGGVVTESGDDALASLVARGAGAGISRLGIGSDNEAPARGDNELADTFEIRDADARSAGRKIAVSTQWPSDELHEQPVNVRELGLFDADTLIARSVFRRVAIDAESTPTFEGILTIRPI